MRLPDRGVTSRATTGPSHARSARPVGRRDLFLAFASAALAGACGGAGSARADTAPRLARRAGARPVDVWSHFDLPAGDSRSRQLSGAAWDPDERVLWCVQDERPRIVALVPDRELRSWEFGETIDLDCRGPVDLEGIVVVPGGFIVSSEEGPRVIEVDRKGAFVRDVALPPRFGDVRHNLSLESLTLSPSKRYLFTTTEAALTRDGDVANPRAGTRVRILRIDRTSGAVTQHTYLTDAARYDPGEWGVSDLTAQGDATLFVLERGWSRGHGNTVRIYETALDDRASCGDVERLSPASPSLAKALRVDLADLAASDFPPARQPQATPLLDNYEGMALGPTLPGDRPSLVLVSDDNGRSDQTARILVLAL